MASYDTGYEDELFEHPVGPSFHCGICYNVVKNPVMCRHNEHLFCRACITRHLMNSQTCPSCLEPLTVDTLRQPSRTIMNLLSELKIHCQFFNRGCVKFIELGNLDRHVGDCGFAPAVCSNEGCPLEVNKQDLLHHETAVCELRRVQCQNCNDIRQEMDAVKVNLAAMNVKLNEIGEKLDRSEKKVEEKLDRNEKKLDRNEKNLKRTVENITVVVENVDAKIELVQGQLSKQKETNCQLKADNVEMKESLNNITEQLEKITQQTSHKVQAEKGKKGTGGINKEPKNVISEGTSKLSVGISNRIKGRTTTTVTSPVWPAASDVLDDVASVEWIKSELISKDQSGMWATGLEHLYKEKFKKVLPVSFIQELKFRPDIATVAEPISGRYLLYAPPNQQPPPTKTNQRHQAQVNVNPDFALPCFLPDVGKSVVVYISHTENPSCFYVSRADAISEMLSEKILRYYKSRHYNPETFPSVSPGQIFCAKYTEDCNFYRARVLEVVDSKHIKVQYVDFGNKEAIPVDRLRVLISEFQTQPIQAYECRLHGVQPADQEWGEAAIAKFDDLTSEKELRMTVHEVRDKVLSVSLVDVSSELDIAEEMKKTGLAMSTKMFKSTTSSSLVPSSG